MSKEPVDLRPDVLRAISLQEVDKRARSHADLASLYLTWLQEHLNVWDLSDSAAFRPQIESWCASLRFHGYEDQRIRDAFTVWVSSQIQIDPSCARRLLVAQEEVLQILGGNQSLQPGEFGMNQGTTGVITVREDKVIDVSSGDEDSDVEFLGWKRPDNTRSASTPAKHRSPPLTGANKETQRMQEAENRQPNDRLKRSKAANVAPSRVPSGRPHKSYVCDRCGEKGHYKEQCPTNLDPSFDPRPTGGYQCYCCGAKEKHLTTLCPHNENPDSVTQQRIRAGVSVMEPSSPLGEADHYRPLAVRSRKAKKTPSKSTNSAVTHGTHLAIGQLEDDDHHRMDPSRRARLERDDHEGSSPLSDERMRGSKRSHYSPTRERRGRRSSKRLRRWREESQSRSPSSRSEREGSNELLPRPSGRNHGDGRLSYWDDGYNDVKMSDIGSPTETRRLVPTVYQPLDNLKAEIQRLYPDADPAWVSDMAGFDVDKFFDGLGGHGFAAIIASGQDEEDAQMDMTISSEGSNLITIRLPPARQAPAETVSISDRREHSDNHQMQSPKDAKPRTGDAEEGSRYSLPNDDTNRNSCARNEKVVVKLPQGGGATLGLDRFSAQVKAKPCASPGLDREMELGAVNGSN